MSTIKVILTALPNFVTYLCFLTSLCQLLLLNLISYHFMGMHHWYHLGSDPNWNPVGLVMYYKTFLKQSGFHYTCIL